MIDPARPVPDSPAIGELLVFERLLAELSAGFVNLSTAGVDDAITDALRRIVALLGVDRANLIRFAPQTGESHVTHSWAVDGFPSAVPRPLARIFPGRCGASRPVIR